MSLDANPYARRPAAQHRGPDGLADVLERILDKGLVVAGDIQINLLDIELITIKVRLLLASADTAQQMGIDWWKHDPFLTAQDRELAQENAVLRDRVDQLEAAMGRKLAPGEPSPGDVAGEGAQEVRATRGQPSPTGAPGNGRSQDADGDADQGGGVGTREVEVDELILEPESGGPALRVSSAEDEESASADEVQELVVDEVVLEHESGGPALRVSSPEELEEAVSGAAEGEDEDEEDEEETYWLDEDTIASMTREELREELAARELSTSGNKSALRDRLLEALEGEWETASEEESSG